MSSLVRRWYVLLVGVALTAAGCYVASTSVSESYESTSSALLLPPPSLVGDKGNPFLYLGGLSAARDVLTARLNSEPVRAPIVEDYPGVSLTIAADTTTAGPIVLVMTEGGSADDATEVARRVLEEIPVELAELQDELEVPDRSRITTMDLTGAAEATSSRKDQIKAIAVVMVGGLAVSVLLVGVIDGWLLARGARRGGGPPSGSRRRPASRRRRDPAGEPETDGATEGESAVDADVHRKHDHSGQPSARAAGRALSGSRR
ncbi:hypothetical protein E8D34_20370 [Nocardioides sp. GY 10113]|uniref:hypothetical protein n=1 Tax=Nocardioides sp. GY 10113 TaxID=2569761 RepID=UPI0010A7FF36|nr:hypothetical protein [Nocardioides sp. GY 10113]TIC79531.1 hypothetical protein E8D34_20370 [Nocardioides sp. GY 10113]